MKKFCLAMLAFGMSLTAAADYYVVGAGVNGSEAWNNPGATQKMTDKGNGVYEWTGTSLKSNFKINEGNWAGEIIGSNNSKLKVGEAYSYNTGSQTTNIEFEGVGEVTNPTVVLNTTAGTILVKGASQAEKFSGLDIYLAGSFNSYNGSDASYKFTEKGTTGVYELTVASFSGNFKVVTPNGWYGTRDAVVFGTSYVLSDISFDNSTFKTAPTAAVTFTYTAESKTLVVTQDGNQGGGDDPQPPVPPVTDEYTYALHGQIFGNTNWSSEDMTNKDGVWSWTGDIVAGSFGIKKCQNGEQVDWIGGAATVEAEGTYDFKAGGNSKSTLAGSYTIAFNPTTGKITFTKNGGGDDPQPPVPPVDNYTYALHGQLTGDSNWSSVNFENNNGVWSWTGNIVAGSFGIKKCENGEQVDWIGGGATIDAEGTYDFKAGDNSKSTLEGSYTIAYNPAEGKITFTKFNGVVEDKIEYILRGNCVSGEWNDYAMTQNGDVWSVKLTVKEGEFGIKKVNNGSQEAWYAAPEATTIAAAGTFQCGDLGVTNFTVALEGEYTFSFNPETLVLTVSGENQGGGDDPIPPVGDYSAYYVDVLGPTVGWVSPGSKQPNAEGIVEFTDMHIGDGGFKVKVWNESAKTDTYYIVGAGTLALNTWTTLDVDGYDAAPTQIAGANANSVYNMEVNVKTLEVKATVASSTGVAEVAVAEGEAVYYNLQGVKVVNPEHGIFVKVVNGKATKVVK